MRWIQLPTKKVFLFQLWEQADPEPEVESRRDQSEHHVVAREADPEGGGDHEDPPMSSHPKNEFEVW